MEDNKKQANVNEILNSQIALTMVRDNDTETKEYLKKLGLPEDTKEEEANNAVLFSTAHYIQSIVVKMQKDLILAIGSLKTALHFYKEKCEKENVKTGIKEENKNGEYTN